MDINDKISRDQEIVGCFNLALKTISEYQQQYDLQCSSKVKFGGIIDDVMNPISLALSDSEFVLYYSSHYIENATKKIINSMIRYIVATNEDFSFKDNMQIREELKKLPEDTQYDSTFRNNYLECDEPIKDAVVCNECLRIYRCDRNSDLFKNFNTYRCDCGGTLSIIEDGKKKIDIFKSNFYKEISLDNIKKSRKERKKKESVEDLLKTEDDFDPRFFNEDVLEFINQVIVETKNHVSRRTIEKYCQEHIKDKAVMNMINEAFPRAYYNFYKYSKINQQKFLIEDPDTRPVFEGFDYNEEMKKLMNKHKSKERLENKVDIQELLESLPDINDSTKQSLTVIFDCKNAKPSKIKIAEYIEQAVTVKNDEFIDVINKHFPDIYLDSFKYIHKPFRGYLYKNHIPISPKYSEEFKKKYPESKYKRSAPLHVTVMTANTPQEKLMNFMKIYPKVGNKELMHEVSDAAYHKDLDYMQLLKMTFSDRFERIRANLPIPVLEFLIEKHM